MPLMFQSTFVSEFLIQIATQQSSYMRENPKRSKVIGGFHCPFKNKIKFVILSFFLSLCWQDDE